MKQIFLLQKLTSACDVFAWTFAGLKSVICVYPINHLGTKFHPNPISRFYVFLDLHSQRVYPYTFNYFDLYDTCNKNGTKSKL